MTRYLYRGPTQLMDFEAEPAGQAEPGVQPEAGPPERVEVHLVHGQHVDVPEHDPIVAGWLDRGIVAPPDETVAGAVNGPAVDLVVVDPPPPAGDPPPPPGEGAGDPPPPPLDGVAIPRADAARVRRPKSKE